jgi:hypothetical protein
MVTADLSVLGLEVHDVLRQGPAMQRCLGLDLSGDLVARVDGEPGCHEPILEGQVFKTW